MPFKNLITTDFQCPHTENVVDMHLCKQLGIYSDLVNLKSGTHSESHITSLGLLVFQAVAQPTKTEGSRKSFLKPGPGLGMLVPSTCIRSKQARKEELFLTRSKVVSILKEAKA